MRRSCKKSWTMGSSSSARLRNVWVCASSETRSGCVHQLAREDGMIPREELEAVARTLQQRIEDLTMELEAALSNRVVPLDDVIEMIGKEPSHV